MIQCIAYTDIHSSIVDTTENINNDHDVVLCELYFGQVAHIFAGRSMGTVGIGFPWSLWKNQWSIFRISEKYIEKHGEAAVI